MASPTGGLLVYHEILLLVFFLFFFPFIHQSVHTHTQNKVEFNTVCKQLDTVG